MLKPDNTVFVLIAEPSNKRQELINKNNTFIASHFLTAKLALIDFHDITISEEQLYVQTEAHKQLFFKSFLYKKKLYENIKLTLKLFPEFMFIENIIHNTLFVIDPDPTPMLCQFEALIHKTIPKRSKKTDMEKYINNCADITTQLIKFINKPALRGISPCLLQDFYSSFNGCETSSQYDKLFDIFFTTNTSNILIN